MTDISCFPPEVQAKITRDEQGVPRLRMAKEILREGIYKHPVKKWTWRVDSKLLNQLATTGNKMVQAGIDPEITVNHSASVASNIGYIKDFYVSGDTLMGIHELIGADSIALALKNKNSSVEFDENFKDGSGKAWGPAVTANSIVLQPVMSNQKGFKIAASLKGLDAAKDGCYHFAMPTETKKQEESETPAHEAAETPAYETAEHTATKHAELMRAHGELARKHAELSSHYASLKDSHEQAKNKLAEVERSKAEMEAAHKELKKKMSLAEDTSEASVELFNERAESVTERLLSLKGKRVELTPALIEKLIPALTTGEGRKFMLSRVSAEVDSPAKTLVAALASEAKDRISTGLQLSLNDDGSVQTDSILPDMLALVNKKKPGDR